MNLLTQMASFIQVVEAGSLTAAARRERLSVPAVSRQLRALEQELGAALIVRSTRQLRITEAGRLWYERCVRILREIEEARASLLDTRSVRGLLTVSAPVTLGLAHIVPHMPELLRRNPGLSLDLRLEDRFVDLVADGVDVAIRAGAPAPESSSIIAQPLMHFTRIAVASPAYLRKHEEPAEPEALRRHSCLIQSSPSPSTPWRFSGHGVERAVDVRGPLRSNAPMVLRDAAVAGLGIALLPEWLVVEQLAQQGLRQVLAGWTCAYTSAWAIYRTELRGSERVRTFVQHLRTAMQGMSAGCGDPSLSGGTPVARKRRSASVRRARSRR